jgi:hypothetical protein
MGLKSDWLHIQTKPSQTVETPHRSAMRYPSSMIPQLVHDDSGLPQRSNTGSALPTHVLPQRAYTHPSFHGGSYNNQLVPPRPQQPIRLVVLPESGVKQWFIYIVGIATIVGLVVAIIAVVVN